jgi:hypothetical protein
VPVSVWQLWCSYCCVRNPSVVGVFGCGCTFVDRPDDQHTCTYTYNLLVVVLQYMYSYFVYNDTLLMLCWESKDLLSSAFYRDGCSDISSSHLRPVSRDLSTSALYILPCISCRKAPETFRAYCLYSDMYYLAIGSVSVMSVHPADVLLTLVDMCGWIL